MLLSLLALFVSPPCAQAAPPLVDAETSSIVRLTVAATDAEAAELENVARELLARLELRVEFRRVERIDVAELRGASGSYFARVWISLDAKGGAHLYLEHGARDRLLSRDVAGDRQNPELLREELGHILQAALEGLKAGEEIGAPRQEALAEVDSPTAPSSVPPAAPKAPLSPSDELAPAATDAPRTLRFGPRYEVVLLGDGGVTEDGPGAALWLSLPSSRRWGVELFGTYHRPFRVERPAIGARLQSWTLGIGLTFEAWRAARSRLRFGAGAAAHLVKVTPFEGAGAPNDIELAATAWRKLALGRLGLTYSHQLTSFLALDATLGAEVDASGSRYVLRSEQTELEVLAPWPLRPLISLGVSVP